MDNNTTNYSDVPSFMRPLAGQIRTCARTLRILGQIDDPTFSRITNNITSSSLSDELLDSDIGLCLRVGDLMKWTNGIQQKQVDQQVWFLRK